MSSPTASRQMRRVILESPYAGDIDRNVAYARACLADALARGDAPIASHLLYTQPGVLRDEVPEERTRGIEAGLAWGKVAEATVVYEDFGWSRGMHLGVERARAEGRPVEVRRLSPDVVKWVLNNCQPDDAVAAAAEYAAVKAALGATSLTVALARAMGPITSGAFLLLEMALIAVIGVAVGVAVERLARYLRRRSLLRSSDTLRA